MSKLFENLLITLLEDVKIKEKNIEIYNDEKGRPIADISKLEIKNIISQDLSISHIENYAMASFTLILDN